MYKYSYGRTITRVSSAVAMPLKLEFELGQPPTDGITNLVFSPAPNSALLLCSSWDNSVRLYDVAQNSLQAMYTHPYAVLDCCFSDPSRAFSAGMDRTLKMFDFPTQTETVLGKPSMRMRLLHMEHRSRFDYRPTAAALNTLHTYTVMIIVANQEIGHTFISEPSRVFCAFLAHVSIVHT